MRYVVVNARVPRGIKRYCAFCCTPIGDSYIRDLQTSIIYDTCECIEKHIAQSEIAIENAIPMAANR